MYPLSGLALAMCGVVAYGASAMLRPGRLLALAAIGVVIGAAVPAAAERTGRTFTVAAAGDVLVHEAVALAARAEGLGPSTYDFRPLLRPIEPWVSEADLAICHLEGTLSPTSTGLLYQEGDEHPAYFNAPHELAEALAATGWDACSTAGNHAADRGLTGIAETLEVLDAAGLGHAGTARDALERLPTFYRVNGVRVAHIAYTIGTNEPSPAVGAVNIIAADAILADARWAREHGSEFTIVSLHWGAEYQVAPDGLQRQLGAALAASSEVDLILGHHAHVVQPVEWIGGKVVVYGLGDHLSNIRTRPDGSHFGAEDGVIVHLTVSEQANGRFTVTAMAVTPTWVDPATKRVLPVDHTLSYGDGSLATSLQASRTRTMARLGLLASADIVPTPTPWPPLICAGRVATLAGTNRPDLLVAGPGDDVVVGRGGDDWIVGGDGNDVVCGGEGNDMVWAGAGSDIVYGGDGQDMLGGGDGPDLLRGDAGRDILGGGGDRDTVYGGEGDDLLSGHGGDDLLVAGPGADVLWGGTGTDTLVGSSAGDVLHGDTADSCRWGALIVVCR